MSDDSLFADTQNTSPGEAEAIRLVRSGVLSVREDGSIWRHTKIHWNGAKNYRVEAIPATRVDRRSNGYRAICVTIGTRKRASVKAHRVVWILANGPIPPKFVINHKNGIRGDNRLSNLEVVTARENVMHAIRFLGKKAPPRRCILTEEDVLKIRSLRGIKTGKDIAREFGVGHSTVHYVLTRQTWKHI